MAWLERVRLVVPVELRQPFGAALRRRQARQLQHAASMEIALDYLDYYELREGARRSDTHNIRRVPRAGLQVERRSDTRRRIPARKKNQPTELSQSKVKAAHS